MLSSFVITLIECLEIAFITLLISQTSIKKSTIYVYAALGLFGGLLSAYYLHDFLEDYEWLMYVILSSLFFYLFLNSKDVVKHIKEHVDTISQTSPAILFLTAFFIYGRESFEIFSNLFLNANASWISAGLATIVAIVIYVFARDSKVKEYIFKFGYWAYLGFALWFGYEALEHLHIL